MKMRSICLAVLVTVVGGLGLSSPAGAYNYFLESVPLYQLDIQNELDTNAFTYTDNWFMTVSVAEMTYAVANGWDNKGIACYVSPAQIPGSVALMRLHNPDSTDHLYTTSWAERQNAIAIGFLYEGIVGYVFPANASVPGTVPLHRFYVGGDACYHFYSTNAAAGGGSSYEGIACHVWSSKKQLVSMTITAPKAGEEVKGLSKYDVSWTSSLPGGYVFLNYSTDAGNSWKLIDSGLENKGFAPWRVPNLDTIHARVQIVWTDNLFGATNVLARVESPSDFKIKKSTLQITAAAKSLVQAHLSSPTALTTKTLSASAIQLSWKAGTGNPKGYIVERQTGSGPFLQVANVRAPSLTYTDSSVSPGTSYAYRVSAYGEGVSSGYSNKASARTVYALKTRGVGPAAQGKPMQRIQQRSGSQ
jgi:hypothetical protein